MTASSPVVRQGVPVVAICLFGFALYLIGFALWTAVSPASFYSAIAPFGPRSDHTLRDAATFELVFGLAALLAVRYRSWRVPVLAGLSLQFGFHSINHLVDINEAHPTWVGVFDFVGLALSTMLLVGLLLRERPLRQRSR